MKINKKIIIITLILTIFISLTTVNAENITDNINTTDLTIHNNTINQTTIQMDYPTGTIYVDSSQATNGDGSQSNPYKDIKTAINSAPTSGTIVLKEGIYSGENNTGITITNYGLKIYGENATINFKDTNNPFTINNQITLSGINFINSQNSTLIINTNFINIENCKFINNTAETGGAIYWKGHYGNLHNSTFINNTAELEGGAIQLDTASNNNITENIFIDNKGDYGGAICIANSASNNIIEYNGFINNTDYFGCDVNINTNSNPSNSINNNWWGNNNPDFKYVKRYITDMAPETWIIMNFTGSSFTNTGGINTLTTTLNTIYNKTSKTFTEFNNNLNRTVYFNANTGSLSPTTTSFTNTASTTYTYPATENIIVTATIDNQTLTLTNKNNQDTFKDLAKIISESTGEINLTKNYTFNINYDIAYLEGIIIDKTLTINGNGNTINADNIARIFNITSDNVKINNLQIINGYNDLNGGSIIWTGTNGIINNTIISNSTAFKGAGLYSTGNYLTIINTTFNNNQADENGGAIYFTGNYANISNSLFTENYAKYYGGAIYAEGKNSNIINSTFTNNTGDICGGALHLFDYTNGIVESNLFLENTAGTGGAICLAGTPTNINITSNVIVNNNDWYNTGVGTFAGSWSNINLNDNWWGENNPAFLYFKEFLPELTPETWVILNFTKNQDFTTTGGIINLTASFTNSYNNTSKKYQDFTGYLPNRTVTFDANLGSLNPNTKTLNQKAETEYTYPSGTNDLIVTANVDNQIVYLTNFEPNDTYTILQSLIDATPEGGELNLSQNYTYSPIFDTIYTDGMFITKTITINGNNYILNSNGQSRVFQVSADNVILNNITFINGLNTDYGGAIYWTGLNGIVNNSHFNNNTASSGGAIFSESENGQITNTIFTNNTADNGGAVTITGTNSIINNTIFNNNAASNAGALSWDWASDGLLLNSVFAENYASGSGGAVSWSGINGEIRNTTFIINSAEINGGAVEWSAMKDGLVNNSIFINNYAGENGGGISWGLFRGNGTVQNSIFENNQASKGGAYYWGLKGNGTIINTTFMNNNATEGGAALFYYANDSRVINSTFIENRATVDGGAIQAVVSNNFLAYNNTFINNNASKDGGAIIYGSTEKMTTYTINNTFIENYALGGGAIYAFTITGIIENNTFTGNTAPDYGGAIYLESGVEYNLTNNKYNKNTATRGGAIYLTSSDYTVLINNSNFNENNASGYGGAIMTFNSKTTITNSNFTNNTASRGGAVGCAGVYNNITNSQFQDNYATVNGGAIFWNNNAGTLANSKFINNSADNLGGGIYWAGSYGQISNTDFIENNASHGGVLLLNGEYFELNNDTFIKNNVTGYGGAIYQAKDNTKITNSIFTENTAQNGLIYSLGTLNITKTNITNNTATYGVILLATKKTQILNSILKNNSAFYLIENKNDLNITGSVILNYNVDYEIYNEGTASAEYNWWGNNTPYLTYINDNLIVNNWIILNGSLNGNIVTATLNTTQNGDSLPSYVELPTTLIIFNSTTGTLNPETNFTNTQMITNTLYSQNTGNNANISISLDNETIYLTGIVKLNTYLYFFNETFILNDTYYLKIRLSNETDGLKNKTVHIEYNGNTYNFTTDNNGEINLSSNTWNILESLTLGENIFYCYFIEDDTYYNSTVYGNIIIMEKTFINSTDFNTSEGSDFNLTISLKNQIGNPIPNQIITLTINNTQFNITTDTNGIATFTYNETIRNYLNLTEGTYTFNYTYNGNTTLYYLSSTNNNTLKIISITKNTTINGNNLNLTTKDIGIFTIKLIDNESNPLPLMTVTVNFNNQTNYYLTNNNGEINIYIINTTPGEYNINYTFNGTTKYLPSNGSNIINITQATKNTIISATNIITDNGTDENFTITLIDEDNKPLPLMTITVNFNNQTNNYTTDSNGQVKINLKNLNPGTYIINYTYNGNTNYTKSNNSNIIIINEKITQLNTTITAENITINNNTTYNYIITLRDENNKPLTGENITIHFNNKTYTKFTDNNGQANIIIENLTTGIYNITYTYNGSKYYNPSNGENTINITPYNPPKTTNIYGSDITIEQGENKNFTITLISIDGTKLSNQNVTIKFNGTNNNTQTNTNGEITINLNTLPTGNYTITYTFNGTEEYLSSFGTNTIQILEKTLNTYLIAENINITTNTTYNYTIELIDELGDKLTDKNVLVSFNGNNYNLTTDTNGKVNITLSNLTSGTYIITYTFQKEGKYLASSNYSTITVSKIIKNTTIKTNLTNTTFILKLTDNASNPISLAIINITINNNINYYVTDGNGEVILSDLSRGEYNISYSFDGTDEYLPTNGSTSFNITIPQTPTLINGTDTTLYSNENTTFTIQLTDINGNPLKNQIIEVSFNNNIINYTTNNLGQINIIISNLTPNNYTINYTFTGTEEYAPSNGTNKITVLEYLENLNTTVSASDLNILTNETTDFIITLKDSNGNTLTNQNITIQFNNTITTKTTNLNGQVNITISNLTKGIYSISYGFAGSGRYQPSYSSNIITVTQSATILNTKITGNNITINENNLTYYTITLYDENNNPLSGKTIQINLNNQNYTKITDSNGEVNIILENLHAGIYNITYNFTGDSNYKKSSGISTINVTPYITPKTTSISASDITMEQGENKELIIILTDINGIKLPYQNVTVNFNGTIDTYVTDINGEIRFNLSTLSIGNYTVKYNFNGTNEYYASFGTNNITITEKTLNTFLIAENINITTNTTYNYTIQLIDELGNNLTSKNVLVSFNGNNYSLTTDTTGKVNITLINLTSGTYIITYTFQKEGKYLASSNYSTITVSKIIKNTTIKTSIINTTFVLKLTDNASNPLSLEIINITINNNTNYYVTNDNGEVILADLSRGEYNISYSFEGTDEYLPTNGSTSFNITIPQTPTLINGNDLTIYSNENTTFTIQLTDINGNPLKNQTIIVSFNNTINNYTTNNLGQVNILISNLTVNNYTINYIFTGTGEYASSNGTNIITILEHLENLNTTISASNLNILTNETIDFIITLKDENNNLLSNENITIQFNNTCITKTTDINGQANITLSNLTAGVYTISYGFAGSGRYQPSYSSNIITVTQSTNILNTTIIGNNITINENNITDYIITLHDENNNPLSGKTIQINLNNQNYTKITDSNGEASIILENLLIGIYNITYNFTGDSNYKKSSGISTINVTPYNPPKTTSINGKDLNITNKDNATFTIRLITIDGKPIPNVTININFNNALITKNTNNNGEANISLNNLNPGKYPIIYSFNGTEEYLPSFNHNTITVNEYINNISTIITGSDITITESDKIQYNISLKDENNKSLSDQNITVIFNSQTHNLTTDTQGYAYLNISNLNIGTYTINYYFQGYKQYQASQGYNTINVTKTPIIKLNTTINANNINLTDNETKEFNITLKDENNKTLKNEIIIVEFNNNTYTLATNTEGKTSLTISNLKPGTYNITYTFNGTNEYNPSKNNNTITVTPHAAPTPTSINAKDINITNKDNITFIIKLITIGGKPIPNATININFNNTTTTKNTNTNGEVNISLNNLKPGTYNITYSFNGTNEYYPSFNYNTITVTQYEKTPTQLIAHNTTITNNTNTTYTIKLIDENNNTLSNQTITVEFNNNTYTLTTNTNGEVQIPLNNLNIGIYNITSTFQETEEYQASNTTNTINVIPKTILNTTINAPNINMTNTETQNLTITLQDQYQNPLIKQNITINFNNNTYNLTTDTNGEAIFTLSNLNPGNYNITYTYQETENYHTSTNTSNITVTNNTQKTLPQIYGYDTIEIINTTTYFTITLQDQYQNPIQNNTITFNIDNNTITSNTDNNGQATITLPNLEEGSYTITYTSQETPEYYQTNNTNRIYAINLNPTNNTNTTNDTNTTNTTNITINTTINTTNLIKYYQTPTPLKGTLTTTNQTPLTNQTITITITKLANKKTKTYTLTTDNNGEFTLPINLANGTYLATIKYNGTTINNTTYNHTTTHITITIKNPPTIHINTTIKTNTYKEQYNTGHTFNGTLTTTNNNTPLPNQTITITLIKTTNNKTKTYNVTTDNNGEFNLPINLAPALYLVYCTYAGTEIYQPTTNYNTITVYGEI